MKGAFGQDNIAIGLVYFTNSLAYIVGTFFGGVLTERLGRRVVLSSGAAMIGLGVIGCGVAPIWPLFMVGHAMLSAGAGVIDGGVNALFMDLYAHRPGGALNRLHLFFSIGALIAPITIGVAVGAGVPWRLVFLVTSGLAFLVAFLLWREPMPDGRHHGPGTDAAGAPNAGAIMGRGTPFALIALAIAIGCYVPSEMGVSNWLVEYFKAEPREVATGALSLFWFGLALGRLVSSVIADRMGPVRFAATWAVIAGVMIIAAVLVPSVPVAIACFAVAGFASGPIYPMIMAVAGAFYPGRTAMVSGILASAAVAGSIIYPPLMGLIAQTIGLPVAMIGAGAFALAAGAAVVAAGRLDPSRAGASGPAATEA